MTGLILALPLLGLAITAATIAWTWPTERRLIWRLACAHVDHTKARKAEEAAWAKWATVAKCADSGAEWAAWAKAAHRERQAHHRVLRLEWRLKAHR